MRSLVLALSLLAAAPASAQRLFDSLSAISAGDVPWVMGRFAVGDVNGDGLPDIFVASAGSDTLLVQQEGSWFANEGSNRLPSLWQLDPGGPGDSVLFDFDGDGDLDLVFAESRHDGRVRACRNDGGVFTDVSNAAFPTRPTARVIEVGDFDGDGNEDVAVGGTRWLAILFGNGAGVFQVTSWSVADVVTELEPGDYDGDGDLDLVVASSSCQSSFLLRNQGGRSLVIDSGAIPPRFEQTGGIGSGDFDGDGDLDLLIASDAGSVCGGTVSVYLNDGSGAFALDPRPLPPIRDLAWDAVCADVDGDGDVDAVVAMGAVRERQLSLWLNDGVGGFAESAVGQLPFEWAPGRSLALTDLNGDGAVELLAGGDRVAWNDGSGGFSERDPMPWDGRGAVASVVADLDGDGFVDFLGSGDDLQLEPTLHHPSTGQTGFGPRPGAALPTTTNFPWAFAALDADRDGDRDVVLAPDMTLWLNDGGGNFHESVGAVPSTTLTLHLAVGDLDGDGDDDLLGSGSQTRSLLSDGAGGFVVGQDFALSGTFAAGPFEVVDWDLDGDLDAALPTGQDVRLFANDGTGTLTSSALHPSGECRHLASGDIDGDGDVDLVGALGPFGPPVLVLRRDAGALVDVTASSFPAATGDARRVRLADLDLDGDLDIVTSRYDPGFPMSGELRCYANDGRGVFADVTSTWTRGVHGNFRDVVVVDVDRDGDPDLVVTGRYRSRLLVNLTRQSLAREEPRVGGVWRLRLRSLGEGLVMVGLPGVSLSASTVPTPTPFGELFLGPGTVVALPFVSVAGNAEGIVTLQVPNDTGLLGLEVHHQALFLDLFGVGAAGLGNRVSSVLR